MSSLGVGEGKTAGLGEISKKKNQPSIFGRTNEAVGGGALGVPVHYGRRRERECLLLLLLLSSLDGRRSRDGGTGDFFPRLCARIHPWWLSPAEKGVSGGIRGRDLVVGGGETGVCARARARGAPSGRHPTSLSAQSLQSPSDLECLGTAEQPSQPEASKRFERVQLSVAQ